jgi:glucose-1-phosphate adenylyltransferase
MSRAFGIITFAQSNVWVEGLQPYRPIGAFTFMGRYRVIDFPISNMSNSGIDQIQVYIKRKPRALAEHLGTGRHYNINSKRGKLHMLFSDNRGDHDIYNNDIAAFIENMETLKDKHEEYVVIAPGYMVYTQDYDQLLQKHIDSGADITLLYHSVDNAKDSYLSCNILNLNKQKGVLSIEPNRGSSKNRNIFMDTYVMKTELFLDLIAKAHKTSSLYTLTDIVNNMCDGLDIRGVSHKGFFASITDFRSYYDSNLALLDYKNATSLINDNWPIYTRTNDSCPAQHFETADTKRCLISNGCLIEGTVENSVIGRGCEIKKGAVVKNCVILPEVVIGQDVHIENMVVDKHARVIRTKEIIADPANPEYIRRDDTL